EEESPLLAENKQFLTLPKPYSETMPTQEGDNSKTPLTAPPTMMETVDDKQSNSNDGGKQ
ncbi:MAG: hypothetical protein OEY65_03195, partial [Gammaproteobacteria bacterium]|nr:hypothetical protein [Gammaproteobacteria bacterium]